MDYTTQKRHPHPPTLYSAASFQLMPSLSQSLVIWYANLIMVSSLLNSISNFKFHQCISNPITGNSWHVDKDQPTSLSTSYKVFHLYQWFLVLGWEHLATRSTAIMVTHSSFSILAQHTSKFHLQSINLVFLWSPYGIGQTIIFSCCGFYLLSSFFS